MSDDTRRNAIELFLRARFGKKFLLGPQLSGVWNRDIMASESSGESGAGSIEKYVPQCIRG